VIKEQGFFVKFSGKGESMTGPELPVKMETKDLSDNEALKPGSDLIPEIHSHLGAHPATEESLMRENEDIDVSNEIEQLEVEPANVDTKIVTTEAVEEVLARSEPEENDRSLVIGEAGFESIMAALKEQTRIKNDKGEEIDFLGNVRDAFVTDVQKSYPMLKSLVSNIYETGKFFHEVRARQKKNGLWIAFINAIGIPRRTAHNYIQAYERLGTRMRDFSYLGVTKLLTITQIKEPVPYLEEYAPEIAKETTTEVRQRVAKERQITIKRPKTKRFGPRVEVLNYRDIRATLSSDGKVVKLIGLNRELQEEVLKLLKMHFSQKK